jgi:hypothetical protein
MIFFKENLSNQELESSTLSPTDMGEPGGH